MIDAKEEAALYFASFVSGKASEAIDVDVDACACPFPCRRRVILPLDLPFAQMLAGGRNGVVEMLAADAYGTDLRSGKAGVGCVAVGERGNLGKHRLDVQHARILRT